MSIAQVNFQDVTDDYAERVYIYNSGAYTINPSATFVVGANGQRSIESFSVRPFDDNFDFDSTNWAAALGNSTLQDAIDPSDIGRKVKIMFTGNVATQTYSAANYANEQALINSWSGVDLLKLNSDIADIALDLWTSHVTKFLDPENRPILYGTVEGDVLDAANINGSVWADANGVPTIDDAQYADNGVVLIAGEGNDTLTGGDYTDKLMGGKGDDVLKGSDGGDNLDGGEGLDTADYSESEVGVTISLSSGSNSASDVLTNIENLILTKHNDRASGNEEDNRLSGSGGKDTLSGGSAGNDTLIGGEAADFLIGGTEDDLLDGDDLNDPAVIGGNDRLYGGEGSDTLLGGAERDYLSGGAGEDLLEGGAGDDILYLGSPTATEAEAAYGGTGNDTLYGSAAPISMYGGDGDDHLWIREPSGTGPTGPGSTISGGTAAEAGSGGDTGKGEGGSGSGSGDEVTLLGGAGMDTYHISIDDQVRIIDSDGQFTIDFTDEVFLEEYYDLEQIVYLDIESAPGTLNRWWWRDEWNQTTGPSYVGHPALGAPTLIIENMNAIIDPSLISIVNGNLQFGFPVEDPFWGAENSSGFTYA